MIKCGGSIINCDVPIYFDTYTGCSFHCEYCIEDQRRRAKRVGPGTSLQAVESFIKGERGVTTKWCDWKIPIHWGVQSEPFMQRDRVDRRSYRILRLFADWQYPVIICTKSGVLKDEEYRSVLRACNVLLQVSMTSPGEPFRTWERGGYSFRDRYAMICKVVGDVKRLVVRAHPYLMFSLDDVLEWIPRYAAAGVYGLSVDGMAWRGQWIEAGLTEWFSGCMVHPFEELKEHYLRIKACCHEHGLRFYAADNRLRFLSDSRTCCGCDGVEGFWVNRSNVNYYPNIRFTSNMERSYTGGVFRSVFPKTGVDARRASRLSYKDAFFWWFKHFIEGMDSDHVHRWTAAVS